MRTRAYLIVVAASWLAAPSAWGQGMIVVAPAGAEAPKPVDDDDEEATESAKAAVMQQPFGWTEETVVQIIFQNRGGGNGRDCLDNMLALAIEDLDRACAPTEAQKAKLRLAARGDIKRLWDQVEAKKRRFREVQHDQNKMQEIFREVQPLQQLIQAGIFGRNSLYGKTVRATLDPDRAGRVEAIDHDRRAYRFRARLELVVTQFESSLGLSDDQRTRLVDTLQAEIKLPERAGIYEYYLVMYLASKIPDEKLKAILDDAQWKIARQQLQMAQGWEQLLKQEGLLGGEAIKEAAVEVVPAAAEMKDGK